MMNPAIEAEITAIVRRALEEDLGSGDVTTECIVPTDLWLNGRLVARAAGIIAGLEIAYLVFSQLDERIQFEMLVKDGEMVEPMQDLARLSGPGRTLLTGERTALNLLQRISGIATETRRYVEAVRSTQAVILDTRKTAPGLRTLDKLAVRLGGGQNHRAGLYDMVLIKNNHIAAVGGNLAETVARIRECDPKQRLVEIEVRNLDQLRQVLHLDVDRILLDNMSADLLQEAVVITDGQVPLEASGGITLENVTEIARTGVDYISIGALTHSVQALDISLWIDIT